MKLTKERLMEMAATDIRTVDISTLTDLRDVKIDTSQPVKRKLAQPLMIRWRNICGD